MSTSIKLNAQKLSAEITKLLSPETINALAVKTGFIQRKSKLDGYKFLDALLYSHFNHKKLALNDLSMELDERYGIKITRQSVDGRFTETAVKFFKSVLETVLRNEIAELPAIDFTNYDRILIKDSTAFQLPENMASSYAGSGGSSSKASVRIQFEYDLKTGRIVDLSLSEFIVQDMVDAGKKMDRINDNDLIIRDLGYIKIKYLQQIQEKGAFYLNRLRDNTNVYIKKGGEYVKIELSHFHKHMKLRGLYRLEKCVYIGKEKFETRMIVELLPEKAYQERLRKEIKKAKSKKRNLTNERKAKIAVNLFITNTDIAAKQIRLLYTLRWQIELVFKIWKSIGEIDKIKKMKVARFEAFLFAKLIWIAINWKILWRMLIYFFREKDTEISPFKLFKVLKNRILSFRTALINGIKSTREFIEKIAQIAPQNLKSEKKKRSITWSYDVIRLFEN